MWIGPYGPGKRGGSTQDGGGEGKKIVLVKSVGETQKRGRSRVVNLRNLPGGDRGSLVTGLCQGKKNTGVGDETI